MREARAPVKAPFDMRRFYNPDLLAGRVAIITGGATGVGLVAARALAQVGATVVLASRKEAFLRRSVEILRSEKLRAEWKVLDVRDALEHSGLPPEALLVELTESTIINDPEPTEVMPTMIPPITPIATVGSGRGFTSRMRPVRCCP